jgi:hypothetical protein
MSRNRFVRVVLPALCTLLPAARAPAANVALPSVNPDVRVAGVTTFGNVAATGFLNDGADGGTTGASMFQVPFSTTPGIPPGSRGFGYDFGSPQVIQSLDLSQFTGESPLGPRARLADVVVHTGAGNFNFSLADQDDVHLDFPSSVVTSWLMVEPVSQHPGGDPQVGIDELAVNSLAPPTSVPRVNVARGKTYTLQGAGWNNVRGSLTDNTLAGANTDLSTSSFNGSLTSPGNSIDLDLGQAFTVDRLGLAEHDYGGAGGRQLVQDVTLDFSDDPAFGTLNASRSLTLDNIPYQQMDFDPATGRYVRITVQSQYPNPDGNLGFTEVQLFQAVPEPGAAALLLVLGLPMLGRRRSV